MEWLDSFANFLSILYSILSLYVSSFCYYVLRECILYTKILSNVH